MIYFKYCILACGGESLAPVGSTLWLLPFILVYAGIKRYKNAQN
jgi:hypothetical protein